MNQQFKFNKVALNSHKGTIIHLRIIFKDENFIDIEPLKDNIGGIIFNSEGIFNNLEINNLKKDYISLINENSEVVDNIIKKDIKGIEPFVIYPDGSIWNGNVGSNYNLLNMMLWSDNLIHNCKNKNIVNDYYKNSTWWDTPSSILLFQDEETLTPCSRIVHTCGKQCE